MTVSLIVAMAENRVIGRQGQLPWHLPADLQRFKRLTMGHHLIMGRKTWESLGRLLPGRTTLVLTRQPTFQAPPGALVAHDLDQALRLAEADPEVFVIGGGEVYQSALPRADRIYLTRVHAQVEGDTWFPPVEPEQWELVEQSQHAADRKHPLAFSFCVYERRRSP